MACHKLPGERVAALVLGGKVIPGILNNHPPVQIALEVQTHHVKMVRTTREDANSRHKLLESHVLTDSI